MSGHSMHVTTRKKRRGLIEKKRRDKINLSLTELRRLVPAASDKQGAAKLEKAEILQLTVDYLRQIRAKGLDKLLLGSCAPGQKTPSLSIGAEESITGVGTVSSDDSSIGALQRDLSVSLPLQQPVAVATATTHLTSHHNPTHPHQICTPSTLVAAATTNQQHAAHFYQHSVAEHHQSAAHYLNPLASDAMAIAAAGHQQHQQQQQHLNHNQQTAAAAAAAAAAACKQAKVENQFMPHSSFFNLDTHHGHHHTSHSQHHQHSHPLSHYASSHHHHHMNTYLAAAAASYQPAMTAAQPTTNTVHQHHHSINTAANHLQQQSQQHQQHQHRASLPELDNSDFDGSTVNQFTQLQQHAISPSSNNNSADQGQQQVSSSSSPSSLSNSATQLHASATQANAASQKYRLWNTELAY